MGTAWDMVLESKEGEIYTSIHEELVRLLGNDLFENLAVKQYEDWRLIEKKVKRRN